MLLETYVKHTLQFYLRYNIIIFLSISILFFFRHCSERVNNDISMGIEINWRLLENKIGIFCLKIVSRYDYIDEWIIKRTFNYMIEDYNYIIWHDISFVLYLTYLRNKYCVSVVIVGGRPFQQFVRPWQLQVTRGNHFLLDLVDLINAAEVEADV